MKCPTCNREMSTGQIGSQWFYVCIACSKTEPMEAKKRTKYNNQRTEWNGVVYDSKKEAAFAQELDLRKEAVEILWWARQPQFVLPGGVIYKADFIYQEVDDLEEIHIVDVKGIRTLLYRTKKKQVESIYHVRIEEI